VTPFFLSFGPVTRFSEIVGMRGGGSFRFPTRDRERSPVSRRLRPFLWRSSHKGSEKPNYPSLLADGLYSMGENSAGSFLALVPERPLSFSFRRLPFPGVAAPPASQLPRSSDPLSQRRLWRKSSARKNPRTANGSDRRNIANSATMRQWQRLNWARSLQPCIRGCTRKGYLRPTRQLQSAISFATEERRDERRRSPRPEPDNIA
jgi:hypothetical protein